MPRRVILLTGYSMYDVLTFPQEQSHLDLSESAFLGISEQ
jgi:hypothetical protein